VQEATPLRLEQTLPVSRADSLDESLAWLGGYFEAADSANAANRPSASTGDRLFRIGNRIGEGQKEFEQQFRIRPFDTEELWMRSMRNLRCCPNTS
jgi:hypothetical protein